MKQKILILGASGFVGFAIFKELSKNKKYGVIGTYHQNKTSIDNPNLIKIDATNEIELQTILKQHSPSIIINCIAISDVEKCENNPLLCEKVNVEPTKTIITYCQNNPNVKYIFFSSGQVFSGSEPKSHDEKDLPSPSNQYGQSKVEAENIIKTIDNYAIIRPSNILGLPQQFQHGNIFNYVYKALKEKKEFKGNTDTIRSPCYLKDLPKMIEKIIEKDKTGIFHAGSDPISIYNFGQMIAQTFNLDKNLVKPQKSDSNDPRPKNSILNSTQTEKELNFHFQSVQDALNDIKKDLEA